MIEKTAGLSVRFAGVARASVWKRAAIIGFGSRSGFPCNLADLNEQMLLLLSHNEKITCPYQLEDGPALALLRQEPIRAAKQDETYSRNAFGTFFDTANVNNLL